MNLAADWALGGNESSAWRYRALRLIGIGLLLILGFGASAGSAESPDVVLKGLDGKDHPLSDYIGRGKWVVLNIWGPKCPPCIEEVPELQVFHDGNEASAMVVGMALDYPSFGYAKIDEVRSFVEEYFITYPILLGDAEIVPRFGAGPLRGTPTTLIYNRDGRLVGQQLGQVTSRLLEDFIARQEAAR